MMLIFLLWKQTVLMDWKHDAEVVDKLSTLLVNTKDDLGEFLEILHPYNDGTPPFAFLQMYGMFVFRYCDHLQKETETDALHLAIADVANHPTVQNMVAQMMKAQIDRGLNLE